MSSKGVSPIYWAWMLADGTSYYRKHGIRHTLVILSHSVTLRTNSIKRSRFRHELRLWRFFARACCPALRITNIIYSETVRPLLKNQGSSRDYTRDWGGGNQIRFKRAGSDNGSPDVGRKVCNQVGLPLRCGFSVHFVSGKEVP